VILKSNQNHKILKMILKSISKSFFINGFMTNKKEFILHFEETI